LEVGTEKTSVSVGFVDTNLLDVCSVLGYVLLSDA